MMLVVYYVTTSFTLCKLLYYELFSKYPYFPISLFLFIDIGIFPLFPISIFPYFHYFFVH